MSKKYYWIIAIVTITIVVMWLFGTYNVILSEPINIGSNQFLDVKTIVLIISLTVGFGIGILMFKKKQKR